MQIRYTVQFKKDYKLMKRRGVDLSKLRVVIDMLANRKPLPDALRDHSLGGDYKGHRECHISPDWLLIYIRDDADLVLTAVRTGSHSELFD